MVDVGDASFSRRKVQLRTKLETVLAECESKMKSLSLYENKMVALDQDMALLEHWIDNSCGMLTDNLSQNDTLLKAVVSLSSEIHIQRAHLTVRDFLS